MRSDAPFTISLAVSQLGWLVPSDGTLRVLTAASALMAIAVGVTKLVDWWNRDKTKGEDEDYYDSD
jgi:hypothetical protein